MVLLSKLIPPSEVDDDQGDLLRPFQLPVSMRRATTGGTVVSTHLAMIERQGKNEWTDLRRVEKAFIFELGCVVRYPGETVLSRLHGHPEKRWLIFQTRSIRRTELCEVLLWINK